MVNCCEHEFSIADAGKAGSNPLNPIEQYYAIQEAKRKSDYVVVIVHGGIEHFNLPTSRMKEAYRFFIDAGADAVINHHQHCYSGYEVYNGKPIFYGLGNFCFDRPQHRNDFWNMGYMVMLDLNDDVNFRLIPYNQCSDEPKIKFLTGSDAKVFDETIATLNDVISDDEKLMNSVRKYYDKCADSTLSWLEPYSGRVCSKLLSMHLLPRFVRNKKALYLKNIITCEAHRDKVLYALIKKTGCDL